MTNKCSYNRNAKVIQTVNGVMHFMDIEHRDKLSIWISTYKKYIATAAQILTFS